MIGLQHYLTLSAILFTLAIAGRSETASRYAGVVRNL